MTDKEAMKLALEALEQTLQTLDDENAKPGGAIADTIWHSEHETLFDYLSSNITALKEALADHPMREVQRLGQEIEQEPEVDLRTRWPMNGWKENKFTPPQRTWVGLTDEEMQAVVDAQPLVSSINVYFRAIEAKLKEKNT
jgi:hypothetical protein